MRAVRGDSRPPSFGKFGGAVEDNNDSAAVNPRSSDFKEQVLARISGRRCSLSRILFEKLLSKR